MQIWYPGPRARDDGDYSVELNPGGKGGPFVIIGLDENPDQTALVIQDLEEARRLRRAAEEAEQLLVMAEARQADLDDTDGPQ